MPSTIIFNIKNMWNNFCNLNCGVYHMYLLKLDKRSRRIKIWQNGYRSVTFRPIKNYLWNLLVIVFSICLWKFKFDKKTVNSESLIQINTSKMHVFLFLFIFILYVHIIISNHDSLFPFLSFYLLYHKNIDKVPLCFFSIYTFHAKSGHLQP